MALLDPAEWVGKTVGGWKIDEHLGGGGFGQVFSVSKAGAQYAMKLVQKHVVTKRGKVQKKESQESAALCLERRMYANWLKQQTAVPKLAPGQNYGVQGQGAEAVRYMVLQKCTSMLSHVLQSHPDGLPAADVALLGLQLVRGDLLRALSALPQTLCAAPHTQMPVLKHLHSKGFVYVDMKADNIMFGLPPHEHQAYLLDYGCSQMYRNLFGKDKFQAPNANGTTLYISTWAHDFQAPHPRNDLLSLAYLLCQCANGSLPWQFERSEAALIAAKRACSPADMAGAVPALAEFVRTVQELDLCSVEQLPYARLERILTSLAPASGRYSSCIVAGAAAPAKAPAAGAAAATAATGGSRRKRRARPAATAADLAAAHASAPKVPRGDAAPAPAPAAKRTPPRRGAASRGTRARPRAGRRGKAPQVLDSPPSEASSSSTGDGEEDASSSDHTTPSPPARRSRRVARGVRQVAARRAARASPPPPPSPETSSDAASPSPAAATPASLVSGTSTGSDHSPSSAGHSQRSTVASVSDSSGSDSDVSLYEESDGEHDTAVAAPARSAARAALRPTTAQGVYGVAVPGVVSLTPARKAAQAGRARSPSLLCQGFSMFTTAVMGGAAALALSKVAGSLQ